MKCPTPNYVWPKDKVIAVPCGKCLACLSNKREDWSFRLMQEYKVSASAFFVTLTYSEKYHPSMGVSKRHLQLYFKRLRKLVVKDTKYPIRYYAVGEYGGQTNRPHYHAIIFNADEKSIRQAWSLFNKVRNKVEPIGIVHCGNVTEASVSYVLKYVVQKYEFPDGLNPSFSVMSRGYGLGANYLSDRMVEWHRSGDRVYTLQYGVKKRLPRFYKEKIWPAVKMEEFPQGWAKWTYNREFVFKKAQKEAELQEEVEKSKLRAAGVKDPGKLIERSRNARLKGIKSKVAYSQSI